MDRKEVEERFWSKVDKTGDCWIWTATKNDEGYGLFSTAKNHDIFNSKRANRISYYFTYGEFDRTLLVCHKCDNPSCVNPNHLFLGTNSDNIVDCVNKGRHAGFTNRAKGERARKKLDWNTVRTIREEYSKGINQVELANTYGVSQVTIHCIVNNKTWIE